MNMNAKLFGLIVGLAVFAVTGSHAIAQVAGSEEDVQIRSINLETQVLELHNFGDVARPLNGWRFCSHDEIDGFDYTSPTGLNGMSLKAGGSLFVHWLNNATMYNQVNIDSLGGESIDDLIADTPGSAISIGIYKTSGFGIADNLVDHIQYSFEGANVPSATPRGGVAVDAELWTATTDWISVDENSMSMLLTADPFPGVGNSHGPTSYEVTGSETFEITPFWFTINVGVLGGGIVEYFSISDNMDVSVRRNPAGLDSVVEFEVQTLSPVETDNVTALEFEYEASVFARGMVTQTISLYDYVAGSFEEVDSRAASRFNDSTVIVTPGGDASRFVEPGTDRMTAKLRYVGAAARLVFAANADYAVWRVTN